MFRVKRTGNILVLFPYVLISSSFFTASQHLLFLEHRRQPKVVVVSDDVAVAVVSRLKTKMTKTVVCRLLFDELLEYEGHYGC